MPIRGPLATTLMLAGAVACGSLLFQVPFAQAQAVDESLVLRTQARDLESRDLRPTPQRPVGRRPNVTLHTSARVVRVGAPIRFHARSNVTGYAHLYVMSASGRVQVWMENVRIAAGRTLTFPTGRLGIRAAPPAGRDDLMLIVTKKRIDGFFGYRTTRWPRALDRSPQSFKRALAARFRDMPERQWGFARTSVRVIGRSAEGNDWGWDPEDDLPSDYGFDDDWLD